MISTVKGTEISFGGTVFMPDVETNVGFGQGSIKSEADLSVIPEVAVASKVSDNFTWGIGMFGTAGMGVDYRRTMAGAPGNYEFVTNLQLMQFAVPLAYSVDGLTVAISPVMQYGSLDINYEDGNPATTTTTQGVAQDFGYGYTIGAAYEMSGLTLGAVYKSAIDMDYKGQIANAANDFGMAGTYTNHLEQPAEYGVGLSYVMGNSTFAVDYKRIQWSDAKGYKDFGWNDQDVYVLGYQYAQDNWALRAGYNHAKSPIKELPATAVDFSARNMFNLLAFPGIVEDHYTIGGSYGINKSTSLDVAYAYADETKEDFAAPGYTGGRVQTVHSQQSVSAQVNFNF